MKLIVLAFMFCFSNQALGVDRDLTAKAVIENNKVSSNPDGTFTISGFRSYVLYPVGDKWYPISTGNGAFPRPPELCPLFKKKLYAFRTSRNYTMNGVVLNDQGLAVAFENPWDLVTSITCQ